MSIRLFQSLLILLHELSEYLIERGAEYGVVFDLPLLDEFLHEPQDVHNFHLDLFCIRVEVLRPRLRHPLLTTARSVETVVAIEIVERVDNDCACVVSFTHSGIDTLAEWKSIGDPRIYCVQAVRTVELHLKEEKISMPLLHSSRRVNV